ncbi:MAG: ABC transporter permease [Actinomycetota bacterium]|nr:ABC transporter permease [Actinomycetota bacterium]
MPGATTDVGREAAGRSRGQTFGEVDRLQRPARLASRRSLLRQLVADRTALAGLVILAVLFLLAVLAPWIAPYDPAAQDVIDRYAHSSAAHLLGTDHLGRDELSRLLYGARVSLFSSVAVGLGILLVGLVIGLVTGFVGGKLDGVIMRVVDVFLAFPTFLLALAVVGVLGPGLTNLALALVLVWWAQYARVVRGLVLSAKERPFVEAAQALGLRPRRVALRHVLPTVLAPVVVLWTLETGRLLLGIAALSFLGLGVQPPTPEWGAMLSEAANHLARAPRLMVYPGALITLAALGFNLVGDGLRDILDPTLR